MAQLSGDEVTLQTLPGVSPAARRAASSRNEIGLASRDVAAGRRETELSVPDVHCAGCIRAVEAILSALPGVERARVNLSTRRVSVRWQGVEAPPLLEALEEAGYPAHLFGPEENGRDPEFGRLMRALAVAGFAAMNIMLLSVSVWSGADASTRQIFHWISAALALPCVAYSGRIFFSPAWQALRHGRTNMDLPISVGVLSATALSLYDTVQGGTYAYFDAATSLLFVLLVGRALDHVMREKARSAVRGLEQMSPRSALVLREDGASAHLALSEIRPGMRLIVAAGDRVPVDGRIESGSSLIDRSIVTGESVPCPVAAHDVVQAGALNLAGPLTMVASADARSSFLTEMVRLMGAAEEGRARYRRLADRAASLYVPIVHLLAGGALLFWLARTGDWHQAISAGVAVLIITCPCALGLAVPMVHVMAARRLFERRIVVRDGSAIERLAEIDTVAFDKTGTLTCGVSLVSGSPLPGPKVLALAAALGRHSSHPHARCLAATTPVRDGLAASNLVEEPGQGIEGWIEGRRYRLGRASWALAPGVAPGQDGTVLATGDRLLAAFSFGEKLRPGAEAAARALRGAGVELAILSGDKASAVAPVARTLAIATFEAALLPSGKVDWLRRRAQKKRHVLMVGDGLNDAPALAAAHVSMAPATAADIGRQSADFVFLGDDLAAVPVAHDLARRASRLVNQNFALAVAYNLVALPIAFLGQITPLAAALAMSASSLTVVGNALRLRAGKEP